MFAMKRLIWNFFAVVAIAGIFAATCRAEVNPQPQEMLQFSARVVDAVGQPVAGAEVIPWALSCSQGHGQWRKDGGDSEPPTLTTDVDGSVVVPYPRFADVEEQVVTTAVTLSINHPEFAYISHEDINVPKEDEQPSIVSLDRGAPVEIVPLENGKPISPTGLYTRCSDARSWKDGFSPLVTADGALSIPPMPAGKGNVLLIRLDGERATHFSPIVELELENGVAVRKHVDLLPAIRIEGRVSDNVPRPVKNGRLKVLTLPRENTFNNLMWYTWTPICEDGSFVIDGWPAEEPMQVIALCDGYMAESGNAPDVVKNPRDPDPFCRPQVFLLEEQRSNILLKMTPTVRCDVEAVDASGNPLAGIKIGSYPNVGWWNGGSQIYCSQLARGEKVLIAQDYFAAADKDYGVPFQSKTDATGGASLELPVGKEELYAGSDDFELPIVRGWREQKINLVAGETQFVRLVLYPKGTEFLGEWDKLAGVLFGCTGEQCRKLLSDPGFKTKMTAVRLQLENAENPTDPKLLSGAYKTIAEAFDELGDQKEEVARWRRKAAEQAAKLTPAK